MPAAEINPHRTSSPHLYRALCRVFAGMVTLGLLWGCAMAPRKLMLKDLSESFQANTIISQKTRKAVSFETLMADLKNARVIYVGEMHTDPEHHKIQLKILKALFEQDPNLAVGMEMFDHSYQHVLDQWSAGKLNSQSFLKKSHWYANWRYDFTLYKDILNFVRKNRIRLVGLNLPFHIPKKIRIGGVENLLEEDKKHLPQKIDTSNNAHRAYLKKIFAEHYPHVKQRYAFESFYEAQCAWEDAMAEAVARHLQNGRMLVIAGNGHIQYKYGIPSRAFNRNPAAFRTIYLSAPGGESTLSIADYIWVTPMDETPPMH